MEKIEIKGEVVNFKYKAIDGTMFNDQKQCELYENTAKCVIQSKLKIKKLDETYIVGGGCCDNIIKVISGKPEDIAMYISFIDTDKIVSLKDVLDSNEPWMIETNYDDELILVCKVSDFINRLTKMLTINETGN